MAEHIAVSTELSPRSESGKTADLRVGQIATQNPPHTPHTRGPANPPRSETLADFAECSLAPYCDLVHVRPCRRQLGAATDQRCERQLESAISRTGAAIAILSAVSTNSSMLDSARIVTSVA